MTPTIRVKGAWAKISDAPDGCLEDCLAIPDPSRWFNRAFKERRWDGMVRLYQGNRFPAGLMERLVEHLVDYDVQMLDGDNEATIDVSRFDETYLGGVGPDRDSDLWEHQVEAVLALLQNKRGHVKVPTGGGKCLGKGTPVLFYDGTAMPVESIREGDLLMGPDSRPRRVLSTCVGYGPLFEIQPKRGESWVCNEPHVLTLVHTETGDIVDIPLCDYLKRSNWFRHCHKQFSVGVEFADAKPVLLDPYFVGLWIGDGTKDLRSVVVTNVDPEVIDVLHQVAESFECRVNTRVDPGRCPVHYLIGRRGRPNLLLDQMRELFSMPREFLRIPSAYTHGTREDRLELLAGIVDSDGYLHNGSYEIAQKRLGIAYDIQHVAQSLGFRALCSDKTVNGTVYQRISISGDVSQIPVRVARKKAAPRRCRKDAARTGFGVEPLGCGEYFGFELDGDGRFLLGDFTVTHNTEIIAAAARYFWEEYGWRSIILTSKKGLAKQTRKRLEMYYDGDIQVGQCGDGVKTIGDVTCCTANTLIQFKPRRRKNKLISGDQELRRMIREYEVIFLDEAHHTSSQSWYDIAMESGAVRRFGLSGTPLKHDALADARMIGATGREVYEVEADVLIEKGLAAKPKIVMVMADECSGPELPYEWTVVGRDGKGIRRRKKHKPYKEAYQLGVVENEYHNQGGVVRCLDWMVQHRRQTLLLCRQKDHFRRLAALLQSYGFEHRAVWGDTSTEDRDIAKQLLEDRKIHVLLASTIFDEGEDVRAIEAIVLAESVKASTNVLQRVGRGMRITKDGVSDVWIVDFVPTCHPKLIEHALERVKAYESEGYEVVVVEEWPEFDDTDFHDDLLPFEQWEKAVDE